jgi:aspartate ammonia-lyase
MGNDLAISMAAEAGQLQLNAMEPLIAGNLHLSMQILGNAVRTLTDKCVRGIEAVPERCLHHLDASTGIATALVPLIGYRQSARIALDSLATGRKVSELVVTSGLISHDEAVQALDPDRLTGRLR